MPLPVCCDMEIPYVAENLTIGKGTAYMPKMLSSRTFRKTFFLYAVIMLIPLLLLITSTVHKNMVEQKQKNDAKLSADAARIAKSIDDKLMELRLIKESIGKQVWPVKLMVDSSVYDQEFDFIKYEEIKKNMNNIISISNIICLGGITYPQKKIVVSQWGKFDTEYFFSKIATMDEHDLKSVSDSLSTYNVFKMLPKAQIKLYGVGRTVVPVVQSLEIVNSPRAAVILYIDVKYLQTFLKNIQGSDVLNISIRQGQEYILDQQMTAADNSSRGKVAECSFNSAVCDWRYEIEYPEGIITTSTADLLKSFSVILLSLAVNFILAFICARISYKPLYEFLNRISYLFKVDQLKNADRSVSEYSLIEKSFNNLVKENKILQKTISDYCSAAKNNLLFTLLKGYFNTEDSDRITEFLPDYTESAYYCVLLLHADLETDLPDIEAKNKVNMLFAASVEKVMTRYGMNCQMFEIENTQTVLILASEENFSDGQIPKLMGEIREEALTVSGIMPDILSGDSEKGLLGISKSFYLANKRLQYLLFSKKDEDNHQEDGFNDSYYYPQEWEIQLINNLKTGNQNVIIRILDEIKRENNKRNLPEEYIKKLISLIMENMLRVLNELNMDSDIYKKQFSSRAKLDGVELLWDYVYEVGSLISERIKYTNSLSVVEQGNRLLIYVNNNYTGIDMSLKKLAEEFDMSISGISKMFKQITGINFYNYVCRLRMEKAKALLMEESHEIEQVANMVGYENIYSFRRAFTRCEGIKPDDYIQMHHAG